MKWRYAYVCVCIYDYIHVCICVYKGMSKGKYMNVLKKLYKLVQIEFYKSTFIFFIFYFFTEYFFIFH